MYKRIDLRATIAWMFNIIGITFCLCNIPVLAIPFFSSALTIFVINLQELKSAQTNNQN